LKEKRLIENEDKIEKLKIPNLLLEAVNRGRADNITANRKTTTGETTIYKTLHKKQ
jgi:hypothetical protein